MIIFEEVFKNFKDKCVLKSINIHIRKGEICGIVGKNGCGKSVFMKLIVGMLYPSAGEITVNGKLLKNGEFPENVGVVLDNVGFLKEYSGFTNLKILASIKNEITTEQIAEAMEAVGLVAKDKTTVAKYSVGMKQKLLIAQAIMESPDLLILDEPFNGLDEESECKISDLLLTINRSMGTTIVIVSHDKEELERLCHKIYKIENKEMKCVLARDF